MNAEQIALVQSSFAKVAPISQSAASLFYGRLFELAPEVRPLFKGNIEEQGRKLMQVIAFAVNALNDTDALLPAVRALGGRHGAYGVKDAHYDIVGEALIWSLEQGLGDAFTPPVRDAWTETYTLLASVMKDSMSKVGRAA
jgi:nitric oxide dioxygenase